MNPPHDGPEPPSVLPRLFLFEPGWRISRKANSEREFCYSMAPGQDYYHRLLDGEVYLHRGDEKVCMPCASRRGFLATDPKTLRDPMPGLDLAIDAMMAGGFDVVVREEDDRAKS